MYRKSSKSAALRATIAAAHQHPTTEGESAQARGFRRGYREVRQVPARVAADDVQRRIAAERVVVDAAPRAVLVLPELEDRLAQPLLLRQRVVVADGQVHAG